MPSDADKETPTRVQEALKLQVIPADRWRAIALRSFVGSLFFALGLFLLWLMYQHHVAAQAISLPLLIAGVILASFGAHIFSGQIFGASIMALAEPLRVIRDFWKGSDR